MSKSDSHLLFILLFNNFIYTHFVDIKYIEKSYKIYKIIISKILIIKWDPLVVLSNQSIMYVKKDKIIHFLDRYPILKHYQCIEYIHQKLLNHQYQNYLNLLTN